METLATLMTPHLGIADISHGKVTGFGAKIYSKITKHEALREMVMVDSKEPQDRYIYKLSKLPGLEWFRNLIIVSSYQDHYCPYDSARIEIGNWGSSSGFEHYKKMVNNLIGKIKPSNLIRVDIHIANDSIIEATLGRKAHMVLIEDFTCQLMFATNYSRFFN